MELSPGTVFASDYEVQRELSAGGMGRVYVVLQRSTGKQRALKLMLPQLVSDPALRKRFEQEARVAALIESDHVVEVVGAGIDEASGAPWLAMELLRGGELTAAAVAATGDPLAATHAILRQVCHAVGAAHAAGIVHRDLKPENIFLAESKRAGEQNTVKVLDFGIAKIAAEASTQHTAAMGSPIWMAPEQSDKGTITPAADVWALGLITYFLLTGKYFWLSAEGAGTIHQVMREVLFEPIPTASQRAAEQGVAAGALPPWFDAWFARCLDRDPLQRFPEARRLFAAFEAAMNGNAPVLTYVAPPLTLPPSPHAPTQLGGATGPAVSYAPTPPPMAVAEVAPRKRSPVRRVISFLVLAFALVMLFGPALKRLRNVQPRSVPVTDNEAPARHDATSDDDDPPNDSVTPSPTLSTPTTTKKPRGHHSHADAGNTQPSLSAALAAEASSAPPATTNNEGGFERAVAIERLIEVPVESCSGVPGANGSGKANVTFGNDGRVANVVVFPEALRGTAAGMCVDQLIRSDTRVQVAPFQGPTRVVLRQFFLKKKT